MKVGYVVLYVTDGEACRRFWTEQVGMIDGLDLATPSIAFRVPDLLAARGALLADVMPKP